MCTSPIQIRRFSPGTRTSRFYTVRCGHCFECRRSYRNDFAAMVVMAASRAATLDFFTFTYRDDTLPFKVSKVIDEAKEDISFVRGLSMKSFFKEGEKLTSPSFEPICIDGFQCFAAPSLCRKDLQDVFKTFRSRFPSAHFKYAFFGEYGDESARPHYHGLITGLSNSEASWLSDYWNRRFGFCSLSHIPAINPDGSPGFVKTAKYVSKYICKKDDLPAFVLDGFAELPRRQSSIRFGSDFEPSELDAIRNFTSPRTFVPIPSDLNASFRGTVQFLSNLINFPFLEN